MVVDNQRFIESIQYIWHTKGYMPKTNIKYKYFYVMRNQIFWQMFEIFFQRSQDLQTAFWYMILSKALLKKKFKKIKMQEQMCLYYSTLIKYKNGTKKILQNISLDLLRRVFFSHKSSFYWILLNHSILTWSTVVINNEIQ